MKKQISQNGDDLPEDFVRTDHLEVSVPSIMIKVLPSGKHFVCEFSAVVPEDIDLTPVQIAELRGFSTMIKSILKVIGATDGGIHLMSESKE